MNWLIGGKCSPLRQATATSDGGMSATLPSAHRSSADRLGSGQSMLHQERIAIERASPSRRWTSDADHVALRVDELPDRKVP
jgi:hypothetical protein